MTMTMRDLIRECRPYSPEELRARALANKHAREVYLARTKAMMESGTVAHIDPPPAVVAQALAKTHGIALQAATNLIRFGEPVVKLLRSFPYKPGTGHTLPLGDSPKCYIGNRKSDYYQPARLAKVCEIGDSPAEIDLCRRMLRGETLAQLAQLS